MPYSPRVKYLAQQIDPECWISYSGKTKEFKRGVDARRCRALAAAEALISKTYKFANRVTFTDAAFGAAAGKAEYNKIMEEIKMAPTFTEAREFVLRGCRNHGVNRARDILRRVGGNPKIMCLTQLSPAHYGAVIREFKKLLDPKPEGKMPLLKLKMMLHFASVLGPYAPEHVRRSEQYVTYVRELLRDGMIERPTNKQRDEHPGWAYKATPRGQCYVKALEAVPLPVRANPEWVMPAK